MKDLIAFLESFILPGHSKPAYRIHSDIYKLYLFFPPTSREVEPSEEELNLYQYALEERLKEYIRPEEIADTDVYFSNKGIVCVVSTV